MGVFDDDEVLDAPAMPAPPLPASRPEVLYSCIPILHTSELDTGLPIRSTSPAGYRALSLYSESTFHSKLNLRRMRYTSFMMP